MITASIANLSCAAACSQNVLLSNMYIMNKSMFSFASTNVGINTASSINVSLRTTSITNLSCDPAFFEYVSLAYTPIKMLIK